MSTTEGVPNWDTMFKARGNLATTGHILSGALFVALCAMTWATGGLQSSGIGWLLVVPMVATLIVGRIGGLVWTVVCVLWNVALFGLAVVGVDSASRFPPDFENYFSFASHTTLFVSVFLVVWTFEVSGSKAMERVAAARDEANRAHKHARAILDNVGEGLVMLNPDGSLQPARSAALSRWFSIPAGRTFVWDLVRPHDAAFAEQLALAWQQFRGGWLPADVALEQMPKRVKVNGRVLQVQWRIAGADDEVMFVATDITSRLAAEAERAEQEELLNLVARGGRSRQQTLDFSTDARRIVDALCRREGNRDQERRWIHTLKGNTAVMGLERLASWLHELETRMGEEQRSPSEAERRELDAQWSTVETRVNEILGARDDGSVRVPAGELDALIDDTRGALSSEQVAARLETWRWDDAEPRMVHLADQAKRLAQRMEKPIFVEQEARGVRTPPTRAWRELWASLVHLVRNSVDHGIETDRAGAGKDGTGRIRLSARNVAGAIEIAVRDDGAGIDWEQITSNAREQGTELGTDAERLAWLLSDGVTTRADVDELSGRGVGTAAVHEKVISAGGTLRVETESGGFTEFTIRVPVQARVSTRLEVVANA